MFKIDLTRINDMLDNVLKWVLSLVILSGFFYLGYIIVSGEIKTTDVNLLLLIGTVFGAASTYAGSVVSYHFGSTKASADKDKTISGMAATIAPAASTTTTTINATKTVEPTS